MINLIVAYEETGIIGINQTIPWRLPQDLQFFKSITKGATVVMGRKTWDSLPNSTKPLPDRHNVVLTSKTAIEDPDVTSIHSEEAFVAYISQELQSKEKVYIIGGEALYALAFKHFSNTITSVIATQVNITLAPKPSDSVARFDKKWLEGMPVADVTGAYQDGLISYNYVLYGHGCEEAFKAALVNSHLQYRPCEEEQYIQLLEDIHLKGDTRPTRGIDKTGGKLTTKSLFGRELRFDLSTGALPICTTRKSWPKGCIEELFWILRGSTDTQELADRGVHVWDANTTRTALDSYGFEDRAEGDIGPSYGFQLRHAGHPYTGKSQDYTELGFDQLNALIRQLKDDPFGRRHLITLWSPAETAHMTLPPCTVSLQFAVNSHYELSCFSYMRSSDVPLALMSWNIPQQAVLTAILAHHLGLKRGELVVNIADAHIYSNQLDALLMTQRTPFAFPTFHILAHHSLHPAQYTYNDIQIHNYTAHPHIPLPMAI